MKALEIQGFKSFPDRTRITFEGGITAVVGPNGSGKSNISDAIRWVLGETSSKQLRGAGKMEDVIFGGTQTRSPMGFASVSLYIDNSAHRLDVEKDEVVITRKYYRSGESEYGINGQNVRLKDIYELFLDTGIGRDGYSIIGQGRIAEIVGAKSGERREIFEEASGIAKYRYRKNEAERKLAGAEDNLVRLRDILDELTARVGPLERDSEKAKKFLELSERRKSLEVTLWADTLRKAKDSVREAQRAREAAQGDYDRASAEIDGVDAETEEIRTEIEQLIMEIERTNAEIRSITEEIAGSDASIAVLRNDISHSEASIASLRDEIAAAGEDDATVADEIAAKRAAIEENAGRIRGQEARIAELSAMLDELSASAEATGERRGVLTERLAGLTQRATDLKVAAAGADSAAESAGARLSSLQDEAASGEGRLQQLRQEQAENADYLARCSADLTRLGNIKEGLSLKLASRQKALDTAAEEARRAQSQCEAAMERIRILKDLEKSMDGYNQSVRHVVKAAQARRLRGVIGPVSSVLTVQPGYELAIETALGFAAQNIVVQDENAAKAAIALLRDDRAGRATFLPLDTVRPSGFDRGRLPAGASLAADLVQADAKYANIVSNLLGRILVVENINDAGRAAKSLDYRYRVVTMDGQVVNAGGSFTGGSASRSAGLFTRRTEIEELNRRVEELSAQRRKRLEALDGAKAEQEKLAAELAATESEAITAAGDKIRAEAEQSRIETALTQGLAAAELMDAEREELEQRMAAARDTIAQSEAESARVAQEISALEAELTGLADGDDSFLETRARLSDEISECKLARLALEKDSESARAAIASLEGRSGESAQRVEGLRASIARLEASIRENEERIAAVEERKRDAAARIAAGEEAIRAATDRRLEKEGSITRQNARMRELTAQREELSREITRLDERRTALETEYDATTAKLWEEYELTLSDAAALSVPFESVTELRRGVAEVRGQIRALGNVNVGAIEEYAEVRERYEFMRSQVADVEKSKAELTKLIAELSGEMKELFSKSFEQINAHFSRIFAELFGGGSARLSLSDEDNVLESGIDISVSPPGKIIKNLSALSGGEQALVAIAIYFAILAVNPAPFCILDEIEAALDDVNVVRYASYLRRITAHTQFIVITHRRGTMEEADVLYGVTMQEDGVSKLLKLDVNEVDAKLIS
nr:chromosome segregation protein SMC [Anaerofilum hominis]